MSKKKINIGTKVRFRPIPTETNFGHYEVVGTIVQIHKAHHWFRIKWGKNTPIYTCRHFSDVGEIVVLV